MELKLEKLSSSSHEPEDKIYKSLFLPVTCRSKVIPSRLILAPINTGFTKGGLPSNRLVKFHHERSGPAIGISMVGNVAINYSNRTNDRTAVLYNSSQIPSYANLANTITHNGSLSGIQLASTPSDLDPTRGWRTRNKSKEIERLKDIVSSYTDNDIRKHLSRFESSASLANIAGFDVIQIHAAHGYFLSLLLHPITNVRKGEFSLEACWLERFIINLREKLGETLLSVRLSLLSGLLPNEEDVNSTRSLTERLAKSGVDIVDLSNGFYTINRQMIYPGSKYSMPIYMPWIDHLVNDIQCLVVINGRITDLKKLTTPLPKNVLLGLGRALIADPNFTKKASLGKFDSINHCTLCNHCHYFSRGQESLECGVNQNL